MNYNTERIIVVDDNEDDRLLMKRSMRRSGINAEVVELEDGRAALEYLLDENSISNMSTLVLLDLNMPKVDGFEVLETMRTNPITREIQIVVLSSSQERSDIQRSYELGANSYLRNPVRSEEFAHTVEQIAAYWLMLNLPPKN